MIELSSESLLTSNVSLSSETIDKMIVRVSEEYIKSEKEPNSAGKKKGYAENFHNKEKAMEFFGAI